MKKAERIHREWFRPISLNNRRSCPECLQKLPPEESIWSWGEYRYAKWKTVMHFCRQCFPVIQAHLIIHAGGCGCKFELVGKEVKLPDWLTLNCLANNLPNGGLGNGTTNIGN